jgi:hypothetical protein
LFAPRNLLSAVTLTLCAVAVAGAIGMILELERGFGGHIHYSEMAAVARGQAILELSCHQGQAQGTTKLIPT